MFVFFPAIHLSLNILQICFHISDILFLISLIKCHKSALSYFSILTLSSEVLGGNGPFVWVLPNHDSASWYKMLPSPSHHHPCSDTCTYPFLHTSWHVKCSKEVTQGRNWRGTVLRAAGAMWRTAVATAAGVRLPMKWREEAEMGGTYCP